MNSQQTERSKEPRSLVLKAGLLHVDIRIEDRPDGSRVLHGQMRLGPAGHPVEGIEVEAPHRSVVTDESGAFAFDGDLDPRQIRFRAPELAFLCATRVA